MAELTMQQRLLAANLQTARIACEMAAKVYWRQSTRYLNAADVMEKLEKMAREGTLPVPPNF